MKSEIVHNSVVALQDHGSYKAPTTNHHIKQTEEIRLIVPHKILQFSNVF